MIPALTVLILAAWVVWLRRRLAQSEANVHYLRGRLAVASLERWRSRR